MARKSKKQQSLEDSALDWLINWVVAQNTDSGAHYFHICEGEAGMCGCEFEGEQ